MRIAVAGAHRTGKTTLVDALAQLLPGFEAVPEPYYQLEDEGFEFSDMPSLDDFEAQLERSISSIVDSGPNQIFDRCPADIAAYLLTHRESRSVDLEAWLPRMREAMQRLDLVVYVPVDARGPGAGSDRDDEDLRVRVDEEVRDILQSDRWELGVDVIEVSGSVRARAHQVLEHLGIARS